MKLQDLTIDQFQRIAALEFSPVLTDYDKRAGVVAIVEGVITRKGNARQGANQTI